MKGSIISLKNNQERNYGIKSYENPDNYDRKSFIDSDDQLIIPFKYKGKNYTLSRRTPMVEDLGVSNYVDISSSTLKISILQRYTHH